LIPDIKAYLLLLTGMNIREFYYDWGLDNHSGVPIGIESDNDLAAFSPQESVEGQGTTIQIQLPLNFSEGEIRDDALHNDA